MQATPGLPASAQWFSFIVSILVSLAALFKLRPSKLDVRLTRETFFRIISTGENVFANVVLLARNGAVLVETARLELQKSGGATKSFPLDIVHVGEKVRSTSVMAEHFFYSSSPLEFVPSDVPKRVLYLGELRDYAPASQAMWDEFQRALSDYKTNKGLGYGPITDKDEAARVLAELDPIVNEHVAKFIAGIQLEGGDYKLSVHIGFRDPGFIVRWSRESSSSIRFTIGNDIKEGFRRQLYSAMLTSAVGVVTNQSPNMTWPSYTPLAIREEEEASKAVTSGIGLK